MCRECSGWSRTRCPTFELSGGRKAAPDNLVAAVIIPCSSRKRSVPEFRARAVSLPRSPQAELETAWLLRLGSLNRACAASDLYSGRGALLGRRSASAAAAPLYIASAGLGLIGATEMVPAYGMTAAPRGEDSIPAMIDGRFDPGAWWAAICAGPVSTTLDRLLEGSEGRLTLLALTRPYAAMLADSLAGLPEAVAAGLRIFGWRLQEVCPQLCTARSWDTTTALRRRFQGRATTSPKGRWRTSSTWCCP